MEEGKAIEPCKLRGNVFSASGNSGRLGNKTYLSSQSPQGKCVYVSVLEEGVPRGDAHVKIQISGPHPRLTVRTSGGEVQLPCV